MAESCFSSCFQTQSLLQLVSLIQPTVLYIPNHHLPPHLSIQPSILSSNISPLPIRLFIQPLIHHQHITKSSIHPSIHLYTHSFMYSSRAYSMSGLFWVLSTRQFLPSRCLQSLTVDKTHPQITFLGRMRGGSLKEAQR